MGAALARGFREWGGWVASSLKTVALFVGVAAVVGAVVGVVWSLVLLIQLSAWTLVPIVAILGFLIVLATGWVARADDKSEAHKKYPTDHIPNTHEGQRLCPCGCGRPVP